MSCCARFLSVRSFTQCAVWPMIPVVLRAVLIFSFVLRALRITRFDAQGRFGIVVSRERMFLFNNLLFVVLTFTILIGTEFTLIVEAVKGKQMSFGRP